MSALTDNRAPLPVLIVSQSGRMLAQSARRSATPVCVVDGFCDTDTVALTQGRCVRAPLDAYWEFSAHSMLCAVEELASIHAPDGFAGCVTGSGLESNLDLLERLASFAPLLGNSPALVASVKTPERFFALLDRLDLPHPPTSFSWPEDAHGWLRKRRGGSGGHHIVELTAATDASPAHNYFQRREPGGSASLLFLADGERAWPVGFNRQLFFAYGERPFCHAGMIGNMSPSTPVRGGVLQAAHRLVRETGLRGLNSLDYLDQGDHFSLLEINPRPSASVELYDEDWPEGLFHWHVQACRSSLPERAAPTVSCRGALVVHTCDTTPIDAQLRFPAWCSDLPQPGSVVEAGHPLCTVHASEVAAEHIEALLRERAAQVRRLACMREPEISVC